MVGPLAVLDRSEDFTLRGVESRDSHIGRAVEWRFISENIFRVEGSVWLPKLMKARVPAKRATQLSALSYHRRMGMGHQERYECDFLPVSWLMAAIVLITAASVFGWGTSYKLSLYKSATEQGKIPIAKLSTLSSDAAKADVEISVSPDRDVAVAVRAGSAVTLLPSVAAQFPTLPNDWRPCDFLAAWDSPALFLRPPPTIKLARA
jgi:hypothetical protein